MKIAVVILNWNGKKFLKKFLPSVIKYISDDAEIIIADNASADDSISFLQNNYPQIRIIQHSKNLGFAKGYNEALSKINADYYVLLNSDIEVTENWIKPVIDLMEKDKNIAVCQPKIMSFYKPLEFEYAGAAGGFIDKYGYPFCKGRIFQTMEEDKGQYDDITEIFWATGACMFVKSDLFLKFGGFDNDFFAHMEEIDFCWRLKNLGYKIMYCPFSKIFHIGGGTLPKKSSHKTFLNFRNNLILLYKNLPGNKLISAFIIKLILDTIAALKFLLDGGFKDFIAVIKAYFSFYSSFLKHYKKRGNIKHIYVSKIYQKSIVCDYFLKGKKFFTDIEQDKFSS